MNLKLRNKNEINKEKIENTTKNDDQEIYDNIKEKLYQDFITDMAESSINIEISEEDIKKAEKDYKNIRLKRIGLYIALIGFFVILIFSAIYQVFLKHEYTGPEIATIANYYNQKTNYNEGGIEGYLITNIETLISKSITLDGDTQDVKYGTPVITKVSPKNDHIANVYFFLDVSTSLGNDTYTCFVSLYYDKGYYYPASDVIVTSLVTAADSTEKRKNPLLSFENIKDDTDENRQSAETFVQNFFTMLYTGQDVSPYYNGDKELYSGDLEFQSMKDFKLYVSPNILGYNCCCTISLKSPAGLYFETTKYMTISRTGDSWVITEIL